MGAAAALKALAGGGAARARPRARLAQPFPTKPVRVVVAFSPGGVTDIIARTIGGKLAELWGQPVVIENRPGAGGSIAAVAVSRAPADGYMLLVHSSGYAINAALNPALPYDPRKDLIDVAPLGSQPMLLVVSPASGIGSVRDLIAAARAKPGGLAYGSAGIGSGAHLNGEKFRIAAAVDVLHVPYKGGAEAIQDTIAQRLGFTFNTVTLALPHIREGRLRPLGSAARSARRSCPTCRRLRRPACRASNSRSGTVSGRRRARRRRSSSASPATSRAPSPQPDVRERFANLGAEADGA